MPIEAVLFAFHISVFAFIATRIAQANASYSNAFLKLYLVQCVSNYMCFVTLFLNRMNDVYGDLFGSFATMVVFNTIYNFSAFFQLATFVAITSNRWSAIVCPLRYDKIWNGPLYQIALALQIVVPFVLALVRPLLAVVLMPASRLTITEAFEQAGYVRAATVSTVNFAVTIVDAGLGTWSVVAFRRMDQKVKKQHRENFLLLVFTLVEMALQILKVIYYALITARVDLAILGNASSYLFSFQALSSPLFLLSISTFIRRGYLSFYRITKTPVTPVVHISVSPVDLSRHR